MLVTVPPHTVPPNQSSGCPLTGGRQNCVDWMMDFTAKVAQGRTWQRSRLGVESLVDLGPVPRPGDTYTVNNKHFDGETLTK